MKKRLLSTLLALCMALTLLPGTALAAETSGICGNGLTWSYSSGTLTIQGTGHMPNYEYEYDYQPWRDYLGQIRTIKIGEGVENIGGCAFQNCTALTSVTIPNSVTQIDQYAFHKCSSLTGVTLPGSVTSIGDWAFDQCGLTSLTIPGTVKNIGVAAFFACENLASLTISNGVTSMESGAFEACTSLKSVTIPSSLTSYSGTFHSCTGLTSVTFSSGCTTVGGDAFSGCTGLTSVTIPNGVKYIQYSAFYGCTGLKSISIPSSVTSIGNWAFQGCTGLKDVYYGGSAGQWRQIDIQPLENDLLRAASIHYNSSAPIFTDLAAGAYYIDAVTWAAGKGIAAGTGSNQFSPNQNCSNAQILTFLWRAYGKPEPKIRNPFTNNITEAYRKAAIWAYEKGMVSGTTFDADKPCTRAMAVTYMWKAAGSPGGSAYAPYTLTCKEWGSSDNLYFDAATVRQDRVTLCDDYEDWQTGQIVHGERTTVPVTLIALRQGSTMTINHSFYANDGLYENMFLGEHYQMGNDGIYHSLDTMTSDVNDFLCESGRRDKVGYAEKVTLDGKDYLITVLQNSASSSTAFTDVPANADYAQAVAWAVAQGITTGSGSGNTFSPNNVCTRAQIMTFLYRNLAK